MRSDVEALHGAIPTEEFDLISRHMYADSTKSNFLNAVEVYQSRHIDRTKKETKPEQGMERFRIEVGAQHGAQPANIVGAIANEAGLDGGYIGNININDDLSMVDLPEGMPQKTFRALKKVWVMGQQLKISRISEPGKKPLPKKVAPKPKGSKKDPAKKRSS